MKKEYSKFPHGEQKEFVLRFPLDMSAKDVVKEANRIGRRLDPNAVYQVRNIARKEPHNSAAKPAEVTDKITQMINKIFADGYYAGQNFGKDNIDIKILGSAYTSGYVTGINSGKQSSV